MKKLPRYRQWDGERLRMINQRAVFRDLLREKQTESEGIAHAIAEARDSEQPAILEP